MKPKFKPGWTVRSRKVGDVPAFTGVIVSLGSSGPLGQMLVRDKHGRHWCRDHTELRRVTPRSKKSKRVAS